MFLTNQQIDQMKADGTALGEPVTYVFLHDDGAGVCGVPARLLRSCQLGEPDSVVFNTDIALELGTPGFYIYLVNVSITPLPVGSVTGMNGGAVLCESAHANRVVAMINETITGSSTPAAE